MTTPRRCSSISFIGHANLPSGQVAETGRLRLATVEALTSKDPLPFAGGPDVVLTFRPEQIHRRRRDVRRPRGAWLRAAPLGATLSVDLVRPDGTPVKALIAAATRPRHAPGAESALIARHRAARIFQATGPDLHPENVTLTPPRKGTDMSFKLIPRRSFTRPRRRSGDRPSSPRRANRHRLRRRRDLPRHLGRRLSQRSSPRLSSEAGFDRDDRAGAGAGSDRPR